MKVDEFGNKVEYVKNEAKETMDQFQQEVEEKAAKVGRQVERKANKVRIEENAKAAGQKVGRGAKGFFEFAGDSIGLMILKSGGNRDLAYRVIKAGRNVGQGAEKVFNTTLSQGGKLIGNAQEHIDVEQIKTKAGEIKNTVGEKFEDVRQAAEDKGVGQNLKTKVEDMFRRRKDEAEADKSEEELKADLENKIAEFEKLYEEDLEKEGYSPEETKETR